MGYFSFDVLRALGRAGGTAVIWDFYDALGECNSFGVVNFATVAPTMKLATGYFKHLSVGAVIGWIYLSHQLGSALGSFVPGVLYDLTGSYDSSFIASIILLAGASAISILLPKPAAQQAAGQFAVKNS
ncbi:hypothetical protein NCCP133_40680 [Cytobacillus sp. NCCP-133]|nr:hypothetical protein NCCP133_40680 [Cytobacillus sp. NCCP-133]